MVEVESSNVESIGVDLLVKFKNGRVYRYADVPFDTVSDLHGSESVGKFLNAAIKPHYAVEEVIAP